MVGKLGILIGSTVAIAVFALACSAPESTKTPLIVCTAGEKGCPQEKPNVPKNGTSTSGGPSSAPTTTPTTPPEGTPNKPPPPTTPTGPDGGGAGSQDAGGEEPPEVEPLGPICTKLEDCCDQLIQQGYDPATCHSIVDTRNENACSLQRKQYTDFGDCSL